MVISVAQAQLFFLAFTRVMAMIIHVPMLGGTQIPNQVRIGLGFMLALIILPWQPLAPDAPTIATLGYITAIGREILIGTMAGFAATLIFNAFSIGGELMGISAGFGAGRVLNPALESSGSALDQLFIFTALLLFIILNGHHIFILAIKQTFDVAPLNTAFPAITSDYLMRLTAQLITTGVQLALPTLGALLLADLALGLLARVAPSIQVFFLGVPAKLALGIAALMLSLSVLFPVLSNMIDSLGKQTLKLLGG